MKSRDVKFTVRHEVDPELCNWANKLKYGFFPKIVLDMLRWYQKHGLLIKGGVNHPDILPPQIPLNQLDQQKSQANDQTVELLNRLMEVGLMNNKLLRSGDVMRQIIQEEQRTANMDALIQSQKELQDKIHALTQSQIQLNLVIQAQSQMIAQLQSRAIVSQPPVSINGATAQMTQELNPVLESNTPPMESDTSSMVAETPTQISSESTDLQTKPVEEDLSDVPKMGSPFKVFRKQG
ncbi:hypothetical protein HLH17_06885 [Acinetobacter sp. ANC 5380]|uniref:Uncharacterized protein n=1 Tax=Acinetobacter terrae TaxID=2731247 RepID=A0A7Y2REN4_9GAMM|nr:hypothetical protein [Acinetobacter terrae]NNH77398.1 hypothetical protein [Acinetobacter terrae]